MKNLSNNSVEHVKNNDINYIRFKILEKYKDKVECIFTLKDLDFGFNTSKKDDIQLNYIKICEELKNEGKNIIRPRQNHTNNVIKLNDETGICPESLEDIDGIITDKKNKILSLTFADCTPIALYDPIKNVIGNIHSGWRGTLNAICINGLKLMNKEFDSKYEDIICIIGPTIRKCHFEVDEDVKDLFYKKYSYLENIDKIIKIGRKEVNKQKYNIDTVLLNKTLLKNIGIKEENIIDSNICTACNVDVCHSHRIEKNLSGRSTLIMYIK